MQKSDKASLIGKLVPQLPEEGESVDKSPEIVKEIPNVSIKLHGKQEALTSKAKCIDEQASGRHGSTRSADFGSKTEETADSGRIINQTAATSAGGSKQNKLVSTLTTFKSGEKASGLREQGKVSQDTDQVRPQRPLKRRRGFQLRRTRRSSQTTLSLTSLHKRQRKRKAKEMGASPEAAAEAAVQSEEEAAMPLECKATHSPEKQTQRKQRKSLFGHRRKPASALKRPKLGRTRTRHVFYTYVSEPIPTMAQDRNEQQLPGQSITPSEGQPSLFSEAQQSSNNSPTPVMSARSSRVIKAPKRFLDEEMIPFPKGSLSTWLKNKQREDGKPSTSLHEFGYDGNSVQSEGDSLSVFSSPSAVTKITSKPNPGSSHLEIYQNLKKLTLKLAEKKKGQPDCHAVYTDHSGSLTSHVRKKRRSKLMMEEMDSPGVVRKLAVMDNADVEAPIHTPFDDIGNNSKDIF